MTNKTWNHPAVRRFFKRYAETSGGTTHIRASTSIPVEPFGEAHRIDAYMLEGPFEPRWDNDLSHRAKASIRKAVAAFVTIDRWIDRVSVTYFTEAEGGLTEARVYYDGFAAATP